MDLKDILKDSKTYADSVVIQVNGQPYTLGALRTLSAADQSAISTREKAVQDKEAAYQKSMDELGRAQKVTAELFAKVTADQEALLQRRPEHNNGGGADDPLARLEGDNILGPLVKFTRAEQAAVKAELAEQKKLNAQILEGIKRMGEGYLTDRLSDTYDRVVPKEAKDKFTLQSLIQHAMANKYTTPGGYVDISKSYNELTAGERLAAGESEAEKKGYERAIKEMQEKGIVVRPPTGAPGMSAITGAGGGPAPSQFKNLDDAFAAAAKDTELWREFNAGTVVQ